MKKNDNSFWITNICARNVSLADLNLTVKAFSSINLLDKKHYKYTLEQLENSVQYGSIHKKSNMIVKRNVPPILPDKKNLPFNRETAIPSRAQSTFVIKEENYDELNVSDEQFAKDNADLAGFDEKPL